MTNASVISFILAYFVIFTSISYKFSSGYDSSKLGFLVADRNAGFWETSLAAGASWILGLALFASSEFGYNMGWTGLFWFVIPQTIGLFIFAWFGKLCNQRITNGYTISGYMKDRYGNSVSLTYQIVLSLISLGFIALTFTALTKFLIFIKIDNVPLVTGLVVIGTLAYALKGGLKTNLITGSIQMIVMLVFCFILLGTVLISKNGVDTFLSGINGKSNYTDLLDPKLLSTFGIVMALTSITGIVGNQSYYQKSFGQQNSNNSVLTFVLGGIFFSIVPLTFGTLGIIAYGSGLVLENTSTAHLIWMQNNLGIAAIMAFGIVVLNASANALDTSGNAFGAIVANDYTIRNSVLASRISIVVIAILGWLISTFNLPMTYIFLTYGVLRITLFIITLLAVGTELLNRYGIMYSIMIIAPCAVYLNLNGMKLEATIIGFFVTPLLSVVISKIIKEKNVI